MSRPPATMTLTLAGALEALELPSVRLRGTVRGRAPVEVPLGLAPVLVGSSADAHLVLDDPSVSRRHAEVRLDPRGIVLRDVGSKNGIVVSGLRILEALLPPGTEAQLGAAALVTEIVGAPVSVPLATQPRFGAALGASVAMRALFRRLERAAATDEPVLLLGESGTGKELLARGVHDGSPRSGGPFVVLDCGAVPPTLVESELFGHAKGAFTGATSARVGLFEQAHGGTLFIDELGELPLELQPKLLRALETRQVRPVGGAEARPADVRVVAATHRDLRAKVGAGSFRADLYYRLAVVPLEVPPLRDRKEDIPLLVQHFLADRDPPCTLAALPPSTLDLLASHGWPGNVRELRNTVARLVLFPELGAQAIDPVAGGGGDAQFLHLPLKEARELVVDDFERRYLVAQLKAHAGNVSAAARAMGISRQFVHRLMAQHGIRSGDG